MAVGHGGGVVAQGPSTPRRTSQSFKGEIEVFTGFKPAIEACYLSWDDYPVPGVTYTQVNISLSKPKELSVYSLLFNRVIDCIIVHSPASAIQKATGGATLDRLTLLRPF